MGVFTCGKAGDSERLILEYFDAIRGSPSHIYHSALPLSPSSCWLRECYKSEIAREVRVVMGLPDRWDACSRTISLSDGPSVFAYWGNSIAAGLGSQVVILDGITGTRTSVLHGHKTDITFLTFSLDGILLLSRDNHGIVKLWDVQTGGAIQTFGNIRTCYSTASISPDNATIALSRSYGTIYLSDVRTGKLHPITSADTNIRSITFSPIDPWRLLLLSGDGTVEQWNIDGRQIGASYRDVDIKRAEDLAYTSDGTRFVFCGGNVAVVWDSESGEQVVKVHAPEESDLYRCCFSPNGKSVACSGSYDIFVWNISISGAPLVKRLTGHSNDITFLAFSSSLISASKDGSVKFWPTDSFPADSTMTGPAATSTWLASAHLFREDGVVVTSDSSGVVKTWDLITGICKSSFSTPAKGRQDTYLAGGTLIIVWWTGRWAEFHVWNVYRGQRLPSWYSPLPEVMDIKISGDRAKIFGQGDGCTETVSVEIAADARRAPGRIPYTGDRFFTHKSRLWLGSQDWWSQGRWDPQDMKVSYHEGSKSRFRLAVVQQADTDTPRGVGDTVTERMVFYFPERYADYMAKIEWDGRYLLVQSPSGETMVLDFDPVCAR